MDVGDLIAEVLRRNDERLIPLGLSSLGPGLLPTARLNAGVTCTTDDLIVTAGGMES